MEFALPRKQQNGPVFHLPFWAFDFSLHHNAGDFAHARLLGTMDRAYIPAFCSQRSSIVEDAGFHYTRGKLKYEKGPFRKLVGSSRARPDAVKYVQFTILALADEVSDITHLEATIEIRDSRLIGIPFHAVESRIQEDLMGLEFSFQYVERFNEILDELNVRL
ncbi:MAG: hypothetical protein HYU64_01120 [Armatimonadetes bacterium]|nr:hypothetical protein [Armatimonadota bacterium]